MKLNRLWKGIKGFWVGFIIFPIASIFIFFETIYNGWIKGRVKNKQKGW